MNALTLDYKKYLKEHANAERAEKEKAYLYSDLKHYGLAAAEMGTFFRQSQKTVAALSKAAMLTICLELWQQGTHEERVFALYILERHKNALNLEDKNIIEKLMRESKGWALLDSLIIPIMPTLLTKYKKTYGWLKEWIKDDDYWIRRSALLAQLLLFRTGSKCDKELFFTLAESQLDESWIAVKYIKTLDRSRARFFIRKAIGWALRELSQKDPGSVVKFLNKNKNSMSGLSYMQGSRKLSDKFKKALK